jgi:hypothetical protein
LPDEVRIADGATSCAIQQHLSFSVIGLQFSGFPLTAANNIPKPCCFAMEVRKKSRCKNVRSEVYCRLITAVPAIRSSHWAGFLGWQSGGLSR